MICSLFSFVLSSITSQYMIIIFIKERILIPTHTLWFYFDYIVIIIHRIKDFYCMISYYIYTRMRAYMWMFMCVHADLVRRVRTTKTILALFCFFFFLSFSPVYGLWFAGVCCGRARNRFLFNFRWFSVRFFIRFSWALFFCTLIILYMHVCVRHEMWEPTKYTAFRGNRKTSTTTQLKRLNGHLNPESTDIINSITLPSSGRISYIYAYICVFFRIVARFIGSFTEKEFF